MRSSPARHPLALPISALAVAASILFALGACADSILDPPTSGPSLGDAVANHVCGKDDVCARDAAVKKDVKLDSRADASVGADIDVCSVQAAEWREGAWGRCCSGSTYSMTKSRAVKCCLVGSNPCVPSTCCSAPKPKATTSCVRTCMPDYAGGCSTPQCNWEPGWHSIGKCGDENRDPGAGCAPSRDCAYCAGKNSASECWKKNVCYWQ